MGGSEYQIKCLLESNLPQDFFDISILCKRTAIGYKPNGYNIVQIAKPNALQYYAHFVDALYLWNNLKHISPNVIYQNIGTSYAGVASYYARKSGCKMVLHIASDNNIVPYSANITLKSLIPYIEKKAFDYAIYNSAKLITQTKNQKQTIEKYYRRSADAVIYNFQPYPQEEIKKHLPVKVVWIANFKRLKQPEIFIRLAKTISKKIDDIEFIMVGRPCPDEKWQFSLEKDISETANLKYMGEKKNREINELLAKSHILVNTSRYEGFSNTFIQAWMRGLPVVSLNSNPDELLNGEQMGYSCRGSFEQLCSDVVQLINNDALREKMGNDAREYSLKNFTMKNVSKILSILVG
jgi:glycosyltransferase involved in cell wall biosynthesis